LEIVTDPPPNWLGTGTITPVVLTLPSTHASPLYSASEGDVVKFIASEPSTSLSAESASPAGDPAELLTMKIMDGEETKGPFRYTTQNPCGDEELNEKSFTGRPGGRPHW
jgi:hypothetical protein